MDGLALQNVMQVGGEGLPRKALEKVVLASLPVPESRKSGNG